MINLGRLGFADEPVVTELAASSLAIALGDEFPADAGELEKMDDPKVVDFVPPSWRAKGDAGYWAKALLPYRKELGIAGAEGDGDALAALIPDLQARRGDERRTVIMMMRIARRVVLPFPPLLFPSSSLVACLGGGDVYYVRDW